ncbi:hypothetical protein DOTSEDRAFT_75684 [Dothistroma septosporum NZE10]|uniref:Uncharacterized protein n=1 Tax=Dothistroma septosporum (strain NZE10 / CBS 128990) TaxID=675120 RepID=M2Y197_DOTSN|nr:hypothetical protein DOTSEDRAFT_75684 [Dothistroma septosporum NZE10]
MAINENQSTDVGARALRGEWEEVLYHKFVLEADMKICFQGASCNILNHKGDVVETITTKDMETERDVQAGYTCYVLKGQVKFRG